MSWNQIMILYLSVNAVQHNINLGLLIVHKELNKYLLFIEISTHKILCKWK